MKSRNAAQKRFDQTMKSFHCDHCRSVVFFENHTCASCGTDLAFVPALGRIAALVPVGDTWRLASPSGKPARSPAWRKCKNYVEQNICNWAVDADDPNPLCQCCRLTQTIPNLQQEGNRQAWFSAKRRLVYSLFALRLPVLGKTEDGPRGVAFEFLADPPPGGESKPVLTGHADGLITINIAEADDAERERRRLKLHEPYRTLLGHLRHEIGHYYWDRLIKDSPRLEGFRRLFGDERQDYAAALQQHYDHGAPADWQDHFISVYATSHPWEDWAETWAHYLHISDTLDTADSCGLSLRPGRKDEPAMALQAAPDNPAERPFDQIVERWVSLSYLLNNLNRGLGHADAYPFVLSAAVIDKLRFVHDTIAGTGQAPSRTRLFGRRKPASQRVAA